MRRKPCRLLAPCRETPGRIDRRRDQKPETDIPSLGFTFAAQTDGAYRRGQTTRGKDEGETRRDFFVGGFEALENRQSALFDDDLDRLRRSPKDRTCHVHSGAERSSVPRPENRSESLLGDRLE